MLILSQGTDDYILAMFQILEKLWPLIFQKWKPKEFDHKATYDGV